MSAGATGGRRAAPGPRSWALLTVALAGVAVLLRRMSPTDPGRAPDSHGAVTPPVPVEPALLARLAGWVPPPPRTSGGRLVAYLWAAPVTAAGMVVGSVAGGRPSLQRGVVVFRGARGPVGAMLRRRGFAATTLGHVVVTTAANPSAELLAHELVHTRQTERWGVAFGPLYVALLGWYGYLRHPLERAARLGSGDRGGPA